MQVVLEKFLHRLLPDDIHERCRGRSFVEFYTDVHYLRPFFMKCFLLSHTWMLEGAFVKACD